MLASCSCCFDLVVHGVEAYGIRTVYLRTVLALVAEADEATKRPLEQAMLILLKNKVLSCRAFLFCLCVYVFCSLSLSLSLSLASSLCPSLFVLSLSRSLTSYLSLSISFFCSLCGFLVWASKGRHASVQTCGHACGILLPHFSMFGCRHISTPLYAIVCTRDHVCMDKRDTDRER